MNYCLFASKQGLLFESHALFEGVNIIGMGVNIVRIRNHIASSLLFTASVAVGNSVIVEIKNEWVDKAILYIAIVGKLGTNKSAPLLYS